jgi:hypothetical protein
MEIPVTVEFTATPAIVVDVAALRNAVEQVRAAGGQVIALTPDQLETLLLVVDENARLRNELSRASEMLRGTLGVIDEVLDVGLASNAPSVPPPPSVDFSLLTEQERRTAYPELYAEPRPGSGLASLVDGCRAAQAEDAAAENQSDDEPS